MLMYLVIPLLGLCGLLVDLDRYVRLRRRGAVDRWAVGACALSDALPFLVPLLSAVVPDDRIPLSLVAQWLVWIWLFTALPRMACYLFERLRHPRAGIVAAAAVALVLLWGATTGRTRLRVERVEVAHRQLPASFDGLRIVQFSDLHLGTQLRPERELRRLVERIDALHPDLVCFTGDLVNSSYTELDDDAMRLLGAIEAPVYAVTGNHDTGLYAEHVSPRENSARLSDAMHRMGWRMLDNETVLLHRGGERIALTGISFDPAQHERRHAREVEAPDFARIYGDLPDSLFDITLVHLPQYWKPLREAGRGDLTLAGHVHGMQFKIGFRNRGWAPIALLYPQWSGRYDAPGSTLYINDGIGCVGFPMRLGAAPEITLITLRRCE